MRTSPAALIAVVVGSLFVAGACRKQNAPAPQRDAGNARHQDGGVVLCAREQRPPFDAGWLEAIRTDFEDCATVRRIIEAPSPWQEHRTAVQCWINIDPKPIIFPIAKAGDLWLPLAMRPRDCGDFEIIASLCDQKPRVELWLERTPSAYIVRAKLEAPPHLLPDGGLTFSTMFCSPSFTVWSRDGGWLPVAPTDEEISALKGMFQ